ncbi:unnamed protein product [Scytosiphon promiscuus]
MSKAVSTEDLLGSPGFMAWASAAGADLSDLHPLRAAGYLVLSVEALVITWWWPRLFPPTQRVSGGREPLRRRRHRRSLQSGGSGGDAVRLANRNRRRSGSGALSSCRSGESRERWESEASVGVGSEAGRSSAPSSALSGGRRSSRGDYSPHPERDLQGGWFSSSCGSGGRAETTLSGGHLEALAERRRVACDHTRNTAVSRGETAVASRKHHKPWRRYARLALLVLLTLSASYLAAFLLLLSRVHQEATSASHGTTSPKLSSAEAKSNPRLSGGGGGGVWRWKVAHDETSSSGSAAGVAAAAAAAAGATTTTTQKLRRQQAEEQQRRRDEDARRKEREDKARREAAAAAEERRRRQSREAEERKERERGERQREASVAAEKRRREDEARALREKRQREQKESERRRQEEEQRRAREEEKARREQMESQERERKAKEERQARDEAAAQREKKAKATQKTKKKSKKAKPTPSTLEQRQTLGVGESLSNGRSVLTVKPNGDLVLVAGDDVVWTGPGSKKRGSLIGWVWRKIRRQMPGPPPCTKCRLSVASSGQLELHEKKRLLWSSGKPSRKYRKQIKTHQAASRRRKKLGAATGGGGGGDGAVGSNGIGMLRLVVTGDGNAVLVWGDSAEAVWKALDR